VEHKTGTVRWWNEDRGHGFIRDKEGVDYFVHHTGILGEKGARKQLARDQVVEFLGSNTLKGPRASMVKPSAQTP
jgi:CspA family cold shock protein